MSNQNQGPRDLKVQIGRNKFAEICKAHKWDNLHVAHHSLHEVVAISIGLMKDEVPHFSTSRMRTGIYNCTTEQEKFFLKCVAELAEGVLPSAPGSNDVVTPTPTSLPQVAQEEVPVTVEEETVVVEGPNIDNQFDLLRQGFESQVRRLREQMERDLEAFRAKYIPVPTNGQKRGHTYNQSKMDAVQAKTTLDESHYLSLSGGFEGDSADTIEMIAELLSDCLIRHVESPFGESRLPQESLYSLRQYIQSLSYE